jgi:hypothetical protein
MCVQGSTIFGTQYKYIQWEYKAIEIDVHGYSVNLELVQ